ncbi:MAG TPA: dolichyl-phosphate beta-glucosyltransferase [Solirubrobacteraceae bacterium]|nr:dolichyl-phosphate beta-glucosyltransferase [Solirubrobacteraceae bacterium]
MSSTQTTKGAATVPPPAVPHPSLPPQPAVEVVIPVFNEEHTLERCVRELRAHMQEHLSVPFRITVADNASADGTLALARSLARELPEVHVIHLEEKGRGRALRAAWLASEADVVAYMDVDLSTGLEALGPLLEPLIAGTADVAIGTRLAPGAEVTRGIKRELVSRTYNILLRLLLDVSFSDAQCGFKAARRSVAAPLLAQVRDEGWFFDTELLYLAQRGKLSIHEVPVRWVEDRDSRVAVLRTALEDLRGIRRLRRTQPGRVVQTGAPARRPVPLT